MSEGLERAAARGIQRERRKRGWTQEELAFRLRDLGFPEWTRARIAAVEQAGRPGQAGKMPGLADMIAFAAAFEVPMSSLFAGERTLVLSEGVGIKPSGLERLFSGDAPRRRDFVEISEEGRAILAADERFRATTRAAGSAIGDLVKQLGIGLTVGELEERMAREMEIEPPELIALAAFGMWGRSMTKERDRIARRPNAKGKQWISRDLRAQLETECDFDSTEGIDAITNKALRRAAARKEEGK